MRAGARSRLEAETARQQGTAAHPIGCSDGLGWTRAMPEGMQSQNQREAHLRALADKLEFHVEKADGRFTLTRTADVSRPVRHEALTMKQAEELLSTWKLRGLGGG